MSVLRFSQEEIVAIRAHPLPWWSQEARWFNGRAAPGTPAEETDENGDPTGFYLMSDSSIDVWDHYILDVLRAGWQYAAAQEDGDSLIAMQQELDWEEWDRILYANETGLLDKETSVVRIMGYLVSLGRSLQVPDPVDEEDNPLISPDPIMLSDLPERPS